MALAKGNPILLCAFSCMALSGLSFLAYVPLKIIIIIITEIQILLHNTVKNK